MRAFVDYVVDKANEKGLFNSSVQIIKPIQSGDLDAFKAQDCVYTVLLRGIDNAEPAQEKRVITCINGATDAYGEYEAYAAFAKTPELRFIVSNTTEAGIVYDENDTLEMSPPSSFPGKLTKFLYERFTAFNGAFDKGLIILPVELIDKNGEKLLECCLKHAERWNLPSAFKKWLNEANIFCNTLVDRIVTGYPADEAAALEAEWGYTDKLIAAGEPFALWVIECEYPEAVAAEFPMDKAGIPVIFTKDLKPYRERKVRLLNGAHTSSVLAAYLSGIRTVGEMMKDLTFRGFLAKASLTELAPTVPLPAKESWWFSGSVFERFENPYIRHNLLSIALNSVSKFRARVLPTILETYEQYGELPQTLCFSLAALLRFYMGGDYELRDDEAVLNFFKENAGLTPSDLTRECLLRADFWGEDLTQIPGLMETVSVSLESIIQHGMRKAVEMETAKPWIWRVKPWTS
ncbi:MAG: tagaturonate reductase [Defluviitaleaceae bacterium]|nr:tagaturonate reductase [Defluviitaleaceae bacterium]